MKKNINKMASMAVLIALVITCLATTAFAANFSCNTCGQNATITSTQTMGDCQSETGPHGNCKIKKSHTQYWNFKFYNYKCSKGHTGTFEGPDYGWNCR